MTEINGRPFNENVDKRNYNDLESRQSLAAYRDYLFLMHRMVTATNDFLIASGAGVVVKKTLAETLTILAHAVKHTNGTDDIQNATAGQKGLATATQIIKLDGIEAEAVSSTTVKSIINTIVCYENEVVCNNNEVVYN